MSADEHHQALRLLAVVGSVTPPGRLRRAAEEAVERARPLVAAAELIDLGEQRISFADGREPDGFGDDTGAVVEAIERAGVVLFATPTYRGSMTGALKNVFDLLPVPALQAKVVGLIAMGGSDHHFLGADRHLRDVLTFFGALVVPVSVYLTGADFVDGVPGESAARALDELIGGAVNLAAAVAGDEVGDLGPMSLWAKAVARR
jgi:NAD(P)H-dependent FMN reductase